jgi:hypothetical protein
VSQELPSLKDEIPDRFAALARSVLGNIPVFGGFAAEAITSLIPLQRIDRIATFATILERRLGELGADLDREKLRREEFVDLFEDTLAQSVRALSPERQEYLAAFLVTSISDDELERAAQKRLLQIVGEINDLEVLILHHRTLHYGEAFRFDDLHGNRISVPVIAMSAPEVEHERTALHRSYVEHLVRLGLLVPRFKTVRAGELPEFDRDTGTLKSVGETTTELGKLVLRYIGMKAEDFAPEIDT